MKVGKHVEEALRYAYDSANYGIKRADEEIERATTYRDDYQKRLDEASARRSECMDQKLELRSTMIKLGLDPEKDPYDG